MRGVDFFCKKSVDKYFGNVKGRHGNDLRNVVCQNSNKIYGNVYYLDPSWNWELGWTPFKVLFSSPLHCTYNQFIRFQVLRPFHSTDTVMWLMGIV